MNQDMKDKINAMTDSELAELIAYAQDVKKVKRAEEKEKEKEAAAERAAAAPSDFVVGEKILVKYYNDWFPGTVVKVNEKSVKVTYTKKDRKTGELSKAEALKQTDKLRKVSVEDWTALNEKFAVAA